MTAKAAKRPFATYFFSALSVVSCAVVAWCVWLGKDYYLLSRSQRPMHAYHDLLRSSGVGGLSFGMAGTILIFLNLTYLIRGRFLEVEWLGSLRSWLTFHVFTGLIGPPLILFHSAFVLRSPLASISALSLAVVAITGVVGRYIYAHTPRSVQGKELELAELEGNLGVYRADLQKMGLSMEMFEKTLPAVRRFQAGEGMFATLASFVEGDRRRFVEYRKLQDAVLASPELRPHTADILTTGRRYFKERQWLDRYYELRAMMASWRFFHRWFAIVMLIVAAFHIFVAFSMGDIILPWSKP